MLERALDDYSSETQQTLTKAFSYVHPSLLNKIAVAIMQAVATVNESDVRIKPCVRKAALIATGKE